MNKIFLSADIEGTTGIAHWNETEKRENDYAYFAKQMTREVNAACRAALEAGVKEILVKDAHDSGRNIDPSVLPEETSIFRGWARHPFSMMFGLDNTFDGVIFTGYHSAAQMNTNPLSHTMNTQNNYVKLNGELCSELLINSLIASYVGVPVYCVTGDRGLCDWMQSQNPNIGVVPVNEGCGSGARSIHPDLALKRIREAVLESLKKPREQMMFAMPDHFIVEVNYKEHTRATSVSFYPGVKQLDSRTVMFEANDYFDVLTFFHFCL